MSERNGRDRLEALESRLKQLEAESAFLRDALQAKLEVPPEDRPSSLPVEWLGRRSAPVASSTRHSTETGNEAFSTRMNANLTRSPWQRRPSLFLRFLSPSAGSSPLDEAA